MSVEACFDKLSFAFLKENGITFCLFVLLVCGFPLLYLCRRPRLNLPPGPLCLPLVGYLPFLGKEPFRTLDNLRKKYGNVFSLYIGPKYSVVLGDYSAVKEAFSNSATLNRPEGAFNIVPDGLGFSSTNGAKWLEQRKTVVRKMKEVGFGKSRFEQLVYEEVSDFLQIIANTKGAPTCIETELMASTVNNIVSLVFNKRLPPGPDRDTSNTGLHAITKLFTQTGLTNSFPWFYQFIVKLKIGGFDKLFSEISGFNAFVRKQIQIHKEAPDDSKSDSFVSSYMEAISDKRQDPDKGFNGEEQRASWEGRLKLPYTYVAMLEGQRWRTIAPMGLARIASVDFKLCGYDVRKGSLIVPNLWAVHNDSRYWKDPEEFIPERFLQNEGKDVNFKLESFMPFSYGKRRCPGETVALMEIFLYFTSIMQKYEIRAPNGGKLNINDCVLGSICMPVAQDLCFIPR